MKRPISRNPFFWIAVGVIVLAIDVPVIVLSVSSFKNTARLAAASARFTNAPALVQSAMMGFSPIEEVASYDYSKKTYPWQVPRNVPGLLQNTAPQVKIVPSEFSPPSGGWTSSGPGNTSMGTRMPAQIILQIAYGSPGVSFNRIMWPDPMPAGQFDFIANLPSGAMEGLQEEIKKVWGLVGERETRDTQMLLLKVDHADAPGLKPGTPVTGPIQIQSQAGFSHYPNMPISIVASLLEGRLRIPVIDNTGLSGRYDIDLPTIRPTFGVRARAGGASAPVPAGPDPDQLEQVRKSILEQLGLDLVPTNSPMEWLVFKKTK